MPANKSPFQGRSESPVDPLTGDKTTTIKNDPAKPPPEDPSRDPNETDQDETVGDRDAQARFNMATQGIQSGATPNPGPSAAPQAGASGHLTHQLSNTMGRQNYTLGEEDLAKLGALKSQALDLVGSITNLGNSEEVRNAVTHIREALFWVHAHMTTDTMVHPEFQPNNKAL